MFPDGKLDRFELKVEELNRYFRDNRLSNVIYKKDVELFGDLYDDLCSVVSRITPVLIELGYALPPEEEF